jgi:hypothetical protein
MWDLVVDETLKDGSFTNTRRTNQQHLELRFRSIICRILLYYWLKGLAITLTHRHLVVTFIFTG